jgi:hypothetical protein
MIATRTTASMAASRRARAQRPDVTAGSPPSQPLTSPSPTTVSFPPTGPAQGTVSVRARLTKGAANSLTFTGGPALGGITVHPVPGTAGTLLVGGQSGRCADVYDNTLTNGTQAELWDCNGGANQAWTYTSRKALVVYGDKCLDAYNLGTTNGTKGVIRDCNGQDNQTWDFGSDGTIRNVHAGRCLDAYNAGNGTPLVLWSCNGGDNQKWSRT